MEIRKVILVEDVAEKIEAKHQVLPDEVEEVFDRRPKFRFVKRGKYRGEDVYSAMGQTESGRYLIVFFIYKTTRDAFVLSARDMDTKEQRAYGKKQRQEKTEGTYPGELPDP